MYIDSTVSSHDVFSIGAPSTIVLKKVGGLSLMEVGALDIFFNNITSKTQLMHGNISWRETCEKDPKSLQFLIEALTIPEDVVLDAYASTC